MILWAILTLMVALAAVGLTLPLARRADAGRRLSTLDVLKRQLDEIDAQAAAGAIPPEDAQGLKGEIKRRMLKEGREPDAAHKPLGDRRRVQLAFGAVAAVALGATALYAVLGRPDAGHKAPDTTIGAMGSGGAAPGAGHPGGDVTAMIAELEGQVKAQPGNAEGWRMLGWSYFQTGRFPEAAQAYARAAELEPTNAEPLSAEGEALVRVAEGTISPQADAAFRRAVAIDPGDPRARYFLAVEKDQKGDHTGALDDWVALLKSAPPGAPWAAEVRAFVIKLTQSRGEDISARLPPTPAGPADASAAPTSQGPVGPGPTPDQMAAASQMSDADRQQMITGMVEGLAAKLRSQPHDVDGWSRLLHARMVLGQPDRAAEAYRDAQKVLTGPELAQVRDAARASGVPGA